MALTRIRAFATTEAAHPPGEGGVSAARFRDVVESDDDRVSGANTLEVELTPGPSAGAAPVNGRFSLIPAESNGVWQGSLAGEMADGMITAEGVARGTGVLQNQVLTLRFRQVEHHPGTPPCTEPKAFYEMEGWILD